MSRSKIYVRNEQTLLPQRGAQARKVFDNRIGQRHDGEIAEEVAQPGEGFGWMRRAECAFVDFGHGDDADREALAAEAIEGALCSWPADGGVISQLASTRYLTGEGSLSCLRREGDITLAVVPERRQVGALPPRHGTFPTPAPAHSGSRGDHPDAG